MRLLLLLSTLLATSTLLAQAKDAPKDHQGKDAAKGAVDFEKQILPILEKNCVECHSTGQRGRDGKPKPPKKGVNFDGKDSILASQKGKLVVAKKAEDSLLYTAISLPADHEDRMPPAKKGDPLPKEQQELIKKWITEGASFGKWVGKKAEDKAGDDKGKDGEKGKDGDKPKGKDAPPPGDKPKGKDAPPAGDKPKTGG
jgi:uncharacterized membrane protein